MNNDTLYINTRGIISYFYLRTSNYGEIRRVYGAKYKPKADYWVFPAMPPFYSWVIEDLTSILGEHLSLDQSVTTYCNNMEEEESKAISGDVRGFSSAFDPYQHQKEGLALLMYAPRCAIFWDPGMGKTKLICDRILWERSKNPKAKALILALRVNLSTWKTEMDVHSQGKEAIVPLSPSRNRGKILKKAIEDNAAGVVCTYETARVAVDMLTNYDYSMIIADECHKMQSYKSKLTLAALTLAKKASYRYILSGTPTKGKPTDIWASLRFLGNFIVPRYWEFDSKYIKRAHYNRHIVIGYKNLDVLNETIAEIANVKTADECLDLPDRSFQVIYCSPEPSQKRVYNNIVKDEEGTVKAGGEEILIPNLLTKISKLSQVCAGFVYKSLKDPAICDSCPMLNYCVQEEILPYTSKCKVVTKDPGNTVVKIGKSASSIVSNCVELCTSHIEAGKKVIVWAKHREMISILYTKISESVGKDSVLRYDSTTEHPGEVERAFNLSPEKKVIVAQITMGIGVTFKAPIMIYTELSFNLADWLQSLDRNWGIRAKGLGPILVQILLIKDSIYESTYDLLKHKVDVASLIKDKPSCPTCPKVFTCLANKIEPYDPNCILDPSVQTLTVKLKEIK
tara:strand:+ start:1555 stop:3429 length:1875 start_codon:yes stop_codon:yes gene_type:complete